MQAWTRFWRQVMARPARQAWGLAGHGATWNLVGLSLQAPGLLRVHTCRQWTVDPAHPIPRGLDALLREAGLARGRARQRVNMALAADQLVMGVLDFPARMPPEDWVAEVQLEVSQMLGKEPDEVHFDFQPAPHSDGLVQRVQWVGCTQEQVTALKNLTREAGWYLDSVEPAVHAAQRAAASLQGGLASLLTQPAQDWQFRLPQTRPHEPEPGIAAAWMPDAELQNAMKSEAGGRLVAAGLALKAWC